MQIEREKILVRYVSEHPNSKSGTMKKIGYKRKKKILSIRKK